MTDKEENIGYGFMYGGMLAMFGFGVVMIVFAMLSIVIASPFIVNVCVIAGGLGGLGGLLMLFGMVWLS